MLKIKDNIDLKELEKYGLRKLNIYDDKIKLINAYCLIGEEEEKYIENTCIINYFVQFYINNRKIEFCRYPEELNWGLIIDKIYELSRDGLVEKVK